MLDSTRDSLLLSVALAVVVVGIGVWRYRRGGAAHASLVHAPETGTAETADAAVGGRPAS